LNGLSHAKYSKRLLYRKFKENPNNYLLRLLLGKSGKTGLSPMILKKLSIPACRKDIGDWSEKRCEKVFSKIGVSYNITNTPASNSIIRIATGYSGSNQTHSRDVLIVKHTFNSGSRWKIPESFGIYKLDHAYISIFEQGKRIGHALVGIRTPRNTYKIVDSFYGESFAIDWTYDRGLRKLGDFESKITALVYVKDVYGSPSPIRIKNAARSI